MRPASGQSGPTRRIQISQTNWVQWGCCDRKSASSSLVESLRAHRRRTARSPRTAGKACGSSSRARRLARPPAVQRLHKQTFPLWGVFLPAVKGEDRTDIQTIAALCTSPLHRQSFGAVRSVLNRNMLPLPTRGLPARKTDPLPAQWCQKTAPQEAFQQLDTNASRPEPYRCITADCLGMPAPASFPLRNPYCRYGLSSPCRD